jgi:hypothetical protein
MTARYLVAAVSQQQTLPAGRFLFLDAHGLCLPHCMDMALARSAGAFAVVYGKSTFQRRSVTQGSLADKKIQLGVQGQPGRGSRSRSGRQAGPA